MIHPSAALTLWLLAGFLLTFPVCFCFGVFLISRLGWTKLAQAYPAGQNPADGVSFHWLGGIVGRGVRYGGCLNVTLARAGIYVVPSWLFHWGHAPLLLPWLGVQLVAEARPQFFGQKVVRFADRDGQRIVLFLPAAALPDLQRLSGRGDFSGEVLR